MEQGFDGRSNKGGEAREQSSAETLTLVREMLATYPELGYEVRTLGKKRGMHEDLDYICLTDKETGEPVYDLDRFRSRNKNNSDVFDIEKLRSLLEQERAIHPFRQTHKQRIRELLDSVYPYATLSNFDSFHRESKDLQTEINHCLEINFYSTKYPWTDPGLESFETKIREVCAMEATHKAKAMETLEDIVTSQDQDLAYTIDPDLKTIRIAGRECKFHVERDAGEALEFLLTHGAYPSYYVPLKERYYDFFEQARAERWSKSQTTLALDVLDDAPLVWETSVWQTSHGTDEWKSLCFVNNDVGWSSGLNPTSASFCASIAESAGKSELAAVLSHVGRIPYTKDDSFMGIKEAMMPPRDVIDAYTAWRERIIWDKFQTAKWVLGLELRQVGANTVSHSLEDGKVRDEGPLYEFIYSLGRMPVLDSECHAMYAKLQTLAKPGHYMLPGGEERKVPPARREHAEIRFFEYQRFGVYTQSTFWEGTPDQIYAENVLDTYPLERTGKDYTELFINGKSMSSPFALGVDMTKDILKSWNDPYIRSVRMLYRDDFSKYAEVSGILSSSFQRWIGKGVSSDMFYFPKEKAWEDARPRDGLKLDVEHMGYLFEIYCLARAIELRDKKTR